MNELKIWVPSNITTNKVLLEILLYKKNERYCFKIVGDIMESYIVDSTDRGNLAKFKQLFEYKTYSYNEMKAMMEMDIYIIFVEFEVFFDGKSTERFEIYDSYYMDIYMKNSAQLINIRNFIQNLDNQIILL